MHPLARVLRPLPWLLWVCLLLATSVAEAAGHTPSSAVHGGALRHPAIAPGGLENPHHARLTLKAVRHRGGGGPADDADTVDPAGHPPLALALSSAARPPAQSSVPVSCTVAGLPSFSILGPLGSRPPPSSL